MTADGPQKYGFDDEPFNPHASSEVYYGAQKSRRGRALSNSGVAGYSRRRPVEASPEILQRVRRLSEDATSSTAPTRFLVDVEETMRIVLAQEDTTGNFQISAEDSGPKVIALGTDRSDAHKNVQIRGTYMMSNLLQELAIAQDHGYKRIVLDEARLRENPVDRLSRLIKTSYWDALTRRMDSKGVERICNDPKNRSTERKNYIYVPYGEEEIAQYYQDIADKNPNFKVEVVVMPQDCTSPEYVKSLNDKPGALALAMKRTVDPETKKVQLEPLPFVVPGDRFNEKYGWDSYFIALGLLIDGKIELAKDIVEHCIFEIKHYGKVLNGTRTYYLGRSHPPFLTDLALQTYQYLDPFKREENKRWLKRAISAAIKEYHTYWMVPDHLDPVCGLTRYRPKALGFPPETEASHFNHIVQPYAEKLGISIEEYMEKYDEGVIKEPELDEYILHDRAVRESGHDTSYRLDRKAADLATVDLNSLLYKYEIDIANCIHELFNDCMEVEEEFDLSPWPITPEAFAAGAPAREKSTSRPMTSQEWYDRAAARQQALDKYCWNEGMGMYFDYDTKARKLTRYESVTTLWPLWAGCASQEQAARLVRDALPKFTAPGGLVSGTEQSRGIISLDRPNRQWDYPYGWSPHQIIAWVGLERYDYGDEAAKLAYRWLFMMTLSFVDFSGIVPEKFDAVEVSHLVDAEYGNQGTMFRCVNREGFGWTNAAFQVGLQYMSPGMRRALAACVPPWELFNLPAPDFPQARRRRQEREAREAEAAAKGLGGEIKRTFHRDHRTLEQAIAQLSLDRSHLG